MGGQPDEPRDLDGGREEPPDDDRTRAVDGASGSARGDRPGGVSSDQVAGVKGDKAVDEID